MLKVEDLKSIIPLKSDEFKSWIKLKVQNVIHNNKSTEINHY